MSVYARFKKEPSGFRKLVELLESTPASRRENMIKVGMKEDSVYTQRAMDLMINFQDILGLNDMEIAELVAEALPQVVGRAISKQPLEVQEKFLKNAKGVRMGQIREAAQENTSLATVGASQLKLIEVTRSLERNRKIPLKRIPD